MRPASVLELRNLRTHWEPVGLGMGVRHSPVWVRYSVMGEAALTPGLVPWPAREDPDR